MSGQFFDQFILSVPAHDFFNFCFRHQAFIIVTQKNIFEGCIFYKLLKTVSCRFSFTVGRTLLIPQTGFACRNKIIIQSKRIKQVIICSVYKCFVCSFYQ
jgi:hypothetical protein